MSTEPDDREIEEFLAGNSRLSKDYAALGREEPPAALDAKILADAAAAVRRAEKPGKPPLWWMRPVALAASVLISVALVWRLGESPVMHLQPPQETRIPVEVLPPAESDREASSPALPAPRLEAPAAAAPPPPPFAESEQAAPATSTEVTVTTRRSEEKLQDVPLAVSAIDAGAVATKPLVKPPPPSAAALDGILDKIAARLEPAGAKESQSPADTRLREILNLGRAGRKDEAAAALAEFARDFPDDPISALVRVPAP